MKIKLGFLAVFVSSVLFFGFSSLSGAAELDAKNLLAQGSAAYDKGDCDVALEKFQAALSQRNLSDGEADQARFSSAYCHFQQEKYSVSESEFRAYVKKYPDSDEARLKLAQSILYQNKFGEAKIEAGKIKQENFMLAAAIVMARAHLGENEPHQAQEALRPYTQGAKSSAEALYWLGVAQYNNDQDDKALNSFQQAQKIDAKNSWVDADSKGWIDRLQSEKQRFHLGATVGWLEGSNIGQSGSTMTFNPGQNQVPSKPTAANTTADRGPYAALDLTYNILASRKHYLSSTISGTAAFYSANTNYNNESFSWNLAYSYQADSETTYGLELKYLESLYNNIFSQDYAIFTPYASWVVGSDFWFKVSLPYNSYLAGKNTSIITPSLDASYQLATWMSTYFGVSYAKSSAPTVVIVNSPAPTVTAGTLATHYTTTGFYLGLGIHLPLALELGITQSNSTTAYDAEPLPPSPNTPPARKDQYTTINFSLTESWIKNVLSSTVSWTASENKSTGFQGIASSGSLSDNSYKRTYLLFTTSYYY